MIEFKSTGNLLEEKVDALETLLTVLVLWVKELPYSLNKHIL